MPDLTVDSNTQASTPGRLEVNKLQWLRCYPKWPLVWLMLFLLMALLSAAYSLGWLILALQALVMNWLYWVRVREHFASGNVCPAVVVSINPLLLAVGTDLSTGGPPHPAIKVINVPRASLTPEQLQTGARVPTVALYSGSLTADSWRDFDPRPAGAVTTNRAAIEELMSHISEDDWSELYRWKDLVPTLSPGLHRV